jgi:hypothetical protein
VIPEVWKLGARDLMCRREQSCGEAVNDYADMSVYATAMQKLEITIEGV